MQIIIHTELLLTQDITSFFGVLFKNYLVNFIIIRAHIIREIKQKDLT